MKYKVCVITGTRADYGLLRELLFRLRDNEAIVLTLVVTGSHLSESFGNTQQEIIDDGFDSFVRILIPIEDDSKGGMAASTGEAMLRFSRFFSGSPFDLLVVLGDRYEILAAVIAASMCGIPVAHISGGDVTEGAIDDCIRHSITKMSQLHFPGCEQSRRRIIQMGEQPDSVFNVGEPGVENCLKQELLSREALVQAIGFDGILGDYCLVTFHPVTLENNTGVEQLGELIQAMDTFPEMYYLITMANADAGGRAINSIWTEAAKVHRNWLLVSSLGVQRYLSAMKYAKAVVGNSSSGLVEAPSIGVPTVNIGDRQKGRMLADSVICCEPESASIRQAMEDAFTDSFQRKSKHVTSPFGDGTTSRRIEAAIMNFLRQAKDHDLKKSFYNIDFILNE